MPNVRMVHWMVLLVAIWASSPVMAWESGSWNPFASSSNASSKSTSSSWLHAPAWMTPSWGSKKKTTVKKQPSMMAKMSKSTKSWWHRTTELLDPFPDSKPAPRPNSSFSSSSKPRESSWFGWGEKKPTEPNTPSEWMSQKRLY